MAKRRFATNPAKVKADYKVLVGIDEPAPRWHQRRLVHLLMVPLLTLLTAPGLILSFAPFDLAALAYVALVPWTLAMLLFRSRWTTLWGWAAGLLFWATSLYWIYYITLEGYSALVAFLSLGWLLTAVVIQAGLRRGLPATLLLPVVWVALEYVREYLISGFPWFFLAHSQYRQTALIQIVDVLGQHGVSFYVAMVNGAIVDLVAYAAVRIKARARRPGAGSSLTTAGGGGAASPAGASRLWRPAMAVAAIVLPLAGMLAYGHWRLAQSERTTRPGPVLGIVQQAYPISLATNGVPPENILADHVAATREMVAGTRVHGVIWAETMLAKGINPDVLDAKVRTMNEREVRSLAAALWDDPGAWDAEIPAGNIRSALHRDIYGPALKTRDRTIPTRKWHAHQVASLSREIDAPLIVGGCTIARNERPIDDRDLYVSRNSALGFDRRQMPVGFYSKIHLVPFGEYVPFKQEWTGLHKFLRSFVPEQMEQLDPGQSHDYFVLTVRDDRGELAFARDDGPPVSPHAAAPDAAPPAPAATRATTTVAATTAATTAPAAAPSDAVAYRIATPICYEGVFSRSCRRLVMKDGLKRVDILVNMSNDGWFVYNVGTADKPEHKGTAEQSQHLAQYVFRAIETRVPVVRAVNTGTSASVDSSGRIVAVVEQGGQTVMVTGTLLLDGKKRNDSQYLPGHGPRVLVDDRVSVYSLAGDAFAQVVSLAGAILVLWLLYKRRQTRKGIAQ